MAPGRFLIRPGCCRDGAGVGSVVVVDFDFDLNVLLEELVDFGFDFLDMFDLE